MKSREQALDCIAGGQFDVCVIGGGATGAGCALDARLRGLKTVLVDAGDLGGATSSASTKIVHGGVRYLEEAVKGLDRAQFRVVKRALRERIRMLRNAPHLARATEFLLPCFRWADAAYYGAGLKAYNWISGDAAISPSHFVSKAETLRRIPGLKQDKLVGSIAYADGQFDDARYNVALVETFAEAGGEALNYARVAAFEKDAAGRLQTAEAEDRLAGKKFAIQARVFVNATGPFSDTVRKLATPGARARMRPSKGVHILVPLEIMPGSDALLIPRTEDGRVLFAIPWMGRLLVGTTEKEVAAEDELFVAREEIQYLLHHLNRYLEKPVTPDQIVSGFAGARPLVARGDARETKKLARDDEIEIDAKSGLISIMGGKWTTYRAMAEDTIDAVQQQLGARKTECITANYPLAGSRGFASDFWRQLVRGYGVSDETARHLAENFGAAAGRVLEIARENAELSRPILKELPQLRAEVAYCARHEMAMTIEDVLFRRLGMQLFSWRTAIHAAPVVATILARELGWPGESIRTATHEYVEKINRYLQLAGLTPENFSDSEIQNAASSDGDSKGE